MTCWDRTLKLYICGVSKCSAVLSIQLLKIQSLLNFNSLISSVCLSEHWPELGAEKTGNTHYGSGPQFYHLVADLVLQLGSLICVQRCLIQLQQTLLIPCQSCTYPKTG